MTMRFATYADFQSWLDARDIFHTELGLARMQKAMASAGLSEPVCPVAQVLGTNGKGSTSTFLSALATSHGLNVGLYTSPHLVGMEERIQINGQPLARKELVDCANEAIEAGEHLTWFEFVTLLALIAFKRRRADLIILEAGLGGANDATTAVPAIAHCFTPIAMDHAAILGPGIKDIARDKARAIKSGSMAFSAPQFAAARKILEEEAARAGVRVTYAQPVTLPETARLRGPHQGINAGLAHTAWRHLAKRLGVTNEPAKEMASLARATLPARLQHIPKGPDYPELWIDGAHNPHGMQTLVRALDELPLLGTIIYSALEDKDWREACSMLARRLPNARFLVPQLHNPRAANCQEIASFLNATGLMQKGCQRASDFPGPDSLKDALSEAGTSPSLLTGSLYLCGEFFQLYPRLLQKAIHQPSSQP